MSDHKGAALIYPMPPDVETLMATRDMMVMHAITLNRVRLMRAHEGLEMMHLVVALLTLFFAMTAF